MNASNPNRTKLTCKLGKISDSSKFKNFITFVIICASILVGFETYPGVMAQYGDLIYAIDSLIIGVFVVEIVIRIGAYGRYSYRFFSDPWNTFDFVIVLVCVLPIDAEFVAVFRLARALRVLRLVTALPRLQLLVGALLKSIPSIGYISVLLMLHFYVYACIATFLFQGNDPVHFGTLHTSMLSLFQVVTLEGWNEIMNIQLYGSDVWKFESIEFVATAPEAFPVVAPLFFISFILFGTMIVLNLFIGVIMNGMAEMQSEHDARELEEKRASQSLTLADEIHLLVRDMETIKEQLHLIRHRISKKTPLGNGSDAEAEELSSGTKK